MEEKKKNIGVWKKKSKAGEDYFGGQFPDGRYFSLFPNKYKVEGDNKPDFQMVINESKVQTVSFTSQSQESDEQIPF